ncbi:hypothetical protein WICPIJ_008773 [Wickerhamomyces pijperi]|uniref:Uncharacterized protein n=1 Tax=Wickerhamomyces pijperi TaxID=599730 RepID=A0A9P8TGP8_WICPI|nr:hypothetical protein WICPIJ_008773 [Wickerhamomyces pijperi]
MLASNSKRTLINADRTREFSGIQDPDSRLIQIISIDITWAQIDLHFAFCNQSAANKIPVTIATVDQISSSYVAHDLHFPTNPGARSQHAYKTPYSNT